MREEVMNGYIKITANSEYYCYGFWSTFPEREVEISMNKPIVDADFREMFFLFTESLRFYAGSTYRTIAARSEDKHLTGFDEGVWNFVLHFYRNHDGVLLGQMLLVISLDKKIRSTLSTEEKDQLGKILKYLWDLVASKFSKDFDTAAENFLSHLDFYPKQNPTHKKLFSQLNITWQATYTQSENRLICFSAKEPSPTLSDFKPEKNFGYLITPKKIFNFYKQTTTEASASGHATNSELIIRELCDHTSSPDFIKDLDLSIIPFKTDDIQAVDLTQERLTVIDRVVKVIHHPTIIVNRGQHQVRLVKNNGSSRVLLPGDNSNKGTVNWLLDGFNGEVLQIVNHSPLIEDKEIKESKSEVLSLREFYTERPEVISAVYQNSVKEICQQADLARQQLLESWQSLPAKAWLMLMTRIGPYLKRFNSGDYKNDKIIDPFYLSLAEPIYLALAEKINFQALQNAFGSTRGSAEEPAELDGEDTDAIANQLQEHKSQIADLSWSEAFKTVNPAVQIESGKQIRIVSIDPIRHAEKMNSCYSMRISNSAIESLKIPSEINFPAENCLLLKEIPRTPDSYSIEQMDYIFGGINRKAVRLTVLYNPEIKAENSKNRQQVLKHFQDKIFTKKCLDILYRYFLLEEKSSGPTLLREYFTKILANDSSLPVATINAGLLLCIEIEIEEKPIRFLIGVGNCLALSKLDDKITTEINSVYITDNAYATDRPVLLSSLNKPTYSAHHKNLIQIKVIDDASKELMLIPGNVLHLMNLQRSSTVKLTASEFFLYYDLSSEYFNSVLDQEIFSFKLVPFSPVSPFTIAARLAKKLDVIYPNTSFPVFSHFLGIFNGNPKEQWRLIVDNLKLLPMKMDPIWQQFVRAVVILYFPEMTSALYSGASGNPDMPKICKYLDEVINLKKIEFNPMKMFSHTSDRSRGIPAPVSVDLSTTFKGS